MSKRRLKCSMPSVKERRVSAFSRSPMWCETKACRSLRQAERVLQLRAAGEHRAGEARERGTAHRDGFRHVAARPPDQHRAATDGAGHGVVGPDVDGPVVGEERVGDTAQPVKRVLVAVGDRLVGDVSAGQHQRAADRGEQQVVQRRVGQHDAELPVARRGRRGDGRVRAPRAAARSAWPGWPAGPPRRRRPGTSRRAAARSAAMTANGLSSRCLRARNAATASSEAASAARW